MTIENLKDLFLHTLQDVYYVEKQIVKTLPKLIKQTDSSELTRALEAHLEETTQQVARLEEVFALLDEKPTAKKCPGIDGILKEGNDLLADIKDPDTCDAGIIASAQAVEHYEITRYGTLVSWAELMGHKDAAQILGKTLKEEYGADQKLTKLAERRLNKEAAA